MLIWKISLWGQKYQCSWVPSDLQLFQQVFNALVQSAKASGYILTTYDKQKILWWMKQMQQLAFADIIILYFI